MCIKGSCPLKGESFLLRNNLMRITIIQNENEMTPPFRGAGGQMPGKIGGEKAKKLQRVS